MARYIEWDYLRGADGDVIRRRKPAEAPEPDRLHFNDPLGTIKGQSKPTRPANPVETYTMSAEGEPLEAQTTDMPSNIRFHGGYLEGKEFDTPPGSDRGHLYRMGVRHYSPALGRFLQRDPMRNFRGPNAEYPLSANPYVYAFNQPLQYADTTGYQACCPVGGLTGSQYGTGKMETPGGGGGEEASCRIGWPDPVCGCMLLKSCCVFASEPEPTKPCDACPGLITHVMCPPSDWTEHDCYCWCCEQRAGGPNAPAHCGPSGVGAIAHGPMGPPELGPWGDGQVPVPLPKWPDPSVPGRHPSLLGICRVFSRPGQANIQVDLGGLGEKPNCRSVTGVVLGVIDASVLWLCDHITAVNCAGKTDLARCLCNACQAVKNCYNYMGWTWFWLGLGIGIIGGLAGGGWVGGYQITMLFWLIGAILTTAACAGALAAVEECYRTYG